jgi:hypothetical protein
MLYLPWQRTWVMRQESPPGERTRNLDPGREHASAEARGPTAHHRIHLTKSAAIHLI